MFDIGVGASAIVSAALSRTGQHIPTQGKSKMFIDLTKGNDWNYIQKINKEVADELFPDRTTQAMFVKLYGELGELANNPDSAGEIADVIILLLDHASRNNINAAHAVLTKLSINLDRSWAKNKMGVYQHTDNDHG